MKITKGATPAIFSELRGSLAGLRWPCFAEIKYDGEACLIGYHTTAPTKIFTSNKYGTMRSDWSKLDRIQDILEDAGITEAVFLAELYYDQGKKGALYDLLKYKDSDDLNLTIYDVGHLKWVDREMKGEHTQLISRKEELGELFQENPEFLPKVHLAKDKAQAEAYFKQATDDGYEGIVVKPLDGFLVRGPCNWVKMKFKDRTEYRVSKVSTTQERIEIDVPTTQQASMNGISIPVVVVCGVKVTNKYKKDLAVGDMVEIEHQGVLDSGSLRHPVFIQKVRKE